jgi:integrase
MSGSSSHDSDRRGSLAKEGFPGLWWRRRADDALVYELKLRQDGVLYSETLPEGTTRRQAETIWKKKGAQRDEGRRPLSQNLTLDAVAVEAFADMESMVAAGIRSQRTLDEYRRGWLLHVGPVLGRKRLSKLAPRDVLAFQERLRRPTKDRKALAEWTVHGQLTTLRMVLRFARRAGYMAHDPFAGLRPEDLARQKARETFEARVLRPEEIRRLIAATSPLYHDAVAVLSYTGLRVSEAAGLVWADVDFVDRVIHVRKQLAPLRPGEEPRRVQLKSAASRRDVPLLPEAFEALVAQLAAEQAKGLGGESDFCFTSETGRVLGRERMGKRGVTRAASNAGLGHVTAQVLRRSVATATAHARIPVVVAAAMTGHSPRVYDEHYAKPFRDAEERARVRDSLASIGFGSRSVDQTVDQSPIS